MNWNCSERLNSVYFYACFSLYLIISEAISGGCKYDKSGFIKIFH